MQVNATTVNLKRADGCRCAVGGKVVEVGCGVSYRVQGVNLVFKDCSILVASSEHEVDGEAFSI